MNDKRPIRNWENFIYNISILLFEFLNKKVKISFYTFKFFKSEH